MKTRDGGVGAGRDLPKWQVEHLSCEAHVPSGIEARGRARPYLKACLLCPSTVLEKEQDLVRAPCHVFRENNLPHFPNTVTLVSSTLIEKSPPPFSYHPQHNGRNSGDLGSRPHSASGLPCDPWQSVKLSEFHPSQREESPPLGVIVTLNVILSVKAAAKL